MCQLLSELMSVNYEESNIKELKNKIKTNHISTQQKLPHILSYQLLE